VGHSPSLSCGTSIKNTTPLLPPKEEVPKESDKFEAHIIGDNSIILRPPSSLMAAKQQPKLDIELSRRGEKIESENSKLFDGVHTLVLPRDQAWGVISVQVKASNPPIFETFELDFGVPW